jgi:NTE family protein
VWQAVVASAAIPGIFPPVRIGPYTLVDGAVVNPVPVNLARAMGADVVVAVDLSDPLAPTIELDADGRRLRRPPLIHRTILRSRDIAMSQMRVHVMGETSVLVKPRVQDISLRKFNEGGRFVAAGEEAVQEALPALHAHLLWLANGVGEH